MYYAVLHLLIFVVYAEANDEAACSQPLDKDKHLQRVLHWGSGHSKLKFAISTAVKGPCRGYNPRFFYNGTTEECQSFVYGGCLGNDNRFETEDDCKQACLSPANKSRDRCLLPKAIGICKEALPAYYFDSGEQQCKQFLYSGCSGNDNRFDSLKDCQEACEGN